jgi:hypothetical protein
VIQPLFQPGGEPAFRCVTQELETVKNHILTPCFCIVLYKTKMHNMKIWFICCALVSALFLQSCSKKVAGAGPVSDVTIAIEHTVGIDPLVFDSLMYKNEAGERFGVSKLNYYLSSVRFYNLGNQVFLVDTTLYVDAREGKELKIKSVPVGQYDSIVVYVGLEARYNHHDSLASTKENLAMHWPDAIGGGFHFLMLEGHWRDGSNQPGFAIHLGANPFLVTSVIHEVPEISAEKENYFTLKMDVNQWFMTPTVYSFDKDGVYTMGISSLMKVIAENGRDAFTIKKTK